VYQLWVVAGVFLRVARYFFADFDILGIFLGAHTRQMLSTNWDFQ
jgi:hypothetical protein